MIVRPFAGGRPPAQLLPRLARARHPFLLDSSAGSADDGRTSFLGCDPVEIVGADTPGMSRDPLRVACSRLEALRDPTARGPGGGRPGPRAVGFLAYELGERIEPRVRARPRPGGAPDLCFAVYDAVYRWDHLTRTATIEADCARSADELEEKLRRAPPCPERSVFLPAPISNLGRRELCSLIRRAQEYVRAGDIYQVNLSRRLDVAAVVDPIWLYGRLRRASPAAFSAYLDLAGVRILSTSPERFLSWDRASGRVETRPIKGTRPRGRTASDDALLVAELVRDEKERAEHLMIVDLERSDLGRIARIGSVRVSRFARVQSLARVHHLVSDVSATVRSGVGLEDLLRATFPGGSITGAPKVRAMQIIAELEPVRRGVYTGAIGHVDRAGGCDLAIAIRTVVVEPQRFSFHVGGGIVEGSDPDREFDETTAKARGILDALEGALTEERIAL